MNSTDGTSALNIPVEARLFSKMARVMGIINRVPKSGNNTFHRYRYATADDVADVIREAMAEVNLALIVQMGDIRQETVEYESSQKTSKSIRTTIQFTFTFACGDTGAVISSPWTAQVDDNSDKAINKCATAAEKYFLMKTFIVSAGDEPDADGDKHREDAGRKVVSLNGNGNGQHPEPHFSQDAQKQQILVNTAIQAGYLSNGQTWSDLLRLAELDDESVLKFATGSDLGKHVKEKAEGLKSELAKPEEPSAEQTRASLSNGGDRRIPAKAKSPEPTITDPEAVALLNGQAKPEFKLETGHKSPFLQGQEQQHVDTINAELDSLFEQTLSKDEQRDAAKDLQS